MGLCVTDAIRRRAPDVARTALTLHQQGLEEITANTGELLSLVAALGEL
jgi:hypothetical protein